MLEPVGYLAGVFNPLARMDNHYSFLQTSEDHDGDLLGENYVPNLEPDTRTEETRAISDDRVYSLGLVDNAMRSIEYEHVTGTKIEFNFFGPHSWWIWKRTYHRPVGWDTKLGDDYVYDHVLR